MPLLQTFVKEIGGDYSFVQNLCYASASMESQALCLISQEEKSKDKALRAIVTAQRLAQRICKFALKQVTSEDISVSLQDVIKIKQFKSIYNCECRAMSTKKAYHSSLQIFSYLTTCI